MRTLQELIETEEPGLQVVREWIAEATNPVEVLACDRAQGERTLLALQVTTRSPLGAIAYETGGLLVDHGWLRILGAGCPRLPRGIADWNGVGAASSGPRLPDVMLVGDDAVGGFFAINGGGLDAARGNICYLPPDTLRWEDAGVSYSDWVHWACTGDIALFYEDARWPGWERDMAGLAGDQGISIHPFLFTEGPPLAERSRRPVPIEELWKLHAIELPKQLGDRG